MLGANFYNSCFTNKIDSFCSIEMCIFCYIKGHLLLKINVEIRLLSGNHGAVDIGILFNFSLISPSVSEIKALDRHTDGKQNEDHFVVDKGFFFP